jgi:hypothetical protein
VNCADIYAGGKDPSWTVPARHPGPGNSKITNSVQKLVFLDRSSNKYYKSLSRKFEQQ